MGHTLSAAPEPVPRCLCKLVEGPPDISLGVYMNMEVFVGITLCGNMFCGITE